MVPVGSPILQEQVEEPRGPHPARTFQSPHLTPKRLRPEQPRGHRDSNGPWVRAAPGPSRPVFTEHLSGRCRHHPNPGGRGWGSGTAGTRTPGPSLAPASLGSPWPSAVLPLPQCRRPACGHLQPSRRFFCHCFPGGWRLMCCVLTPRPACPP